MSFSPKHLSSKDIWLVMFLSFPSCFPPKRLYCLFKSSIVFAIRNPSVVSFLLLDHGRKMLCTRKNCAKRTAVETINWDSFMLNYLRICKAENIKLSFNSLTEHNPNPAISLYCVEKISQTGLFPPLRFGHHDSTNVEENSPICSQSLHSKFGSQSKYFFPKCHLS